MDILLGILTLIIVLSIIPVTIFFTIKLYRKPIIGLQKNNYITLLSAGFLAFIVFWHFGFNQAILLKSLIFAGIIFIISYFFTKQHYNNYIEGSNYIRDEKKFRIRMILVFAIILVIVALSHTKYSSGFNKIGDIILNIKWPLLGVFLGSFLISIYKCIYIAMLEKKIGKPIIIVYREKSLIG